MANNAFWNYNGKFIYGYENRMAVGFGGVLNGNWCMGYGVQNNILGKGNENFVPRNWIGTFVRKIWIGTHVWWQEWEGWYREWYLV